MDANRKISMSYNHNGFTVMIIDDNVELEVVLREKISEDYTPTERYNLGLRLARLLHQTLFNFVGDIGMQVRISKREGQKPYDLEDVYHLSDVPPNRTPAELLSYDSMYAGNQFPGLQKTLSFYKRLGLSVDPRNWS